jgi:Cu+-exporting ATPase
MADERTISLTVAQLDCADEARQIEGAVAAMPGVVRVQTAVGARKAIVTFDPARVAPEAIQQAIRGLGMSVDEPPPPVGPAGRLGRQIGWVFVSGVALVALVGMVGERLGILERVTDLVPAWVAVLAVLVGGYPIFRNVVHALGNRAVTAHALMTLGIAGALAIGQYGAAAIIVFFMRFADFLESFTTERARQAIRALVSLAPDRARVLRGGQETECLADEVQRGEVVLVKPGERIPVDGAVVEGRAAVNQAPITGESVPVEKEAGSAVFAATICERGALRILAEKVGRDTTFAQIVRLVEEAEANKAPVQRFADRFTAGYIPVVVGVAALTYLIGGNATAAVAVVLVACSCAIAMATPMSVLASVGRAARRGVIIKGGRYLEALAKVDTLVMDKTGTLTVGRPEVTAVVPWAGEDEETVLTLAASVERLSEHPLADGIVRAAEARGLGLAKPSRFEAIPGHGVLADLDGSRVACGTERLLDGLHVTVPSELQARAMALASRGASLAFVARDERPIGIVALADTLRPEVVAALAEIRALGVRRLLVLTGDRREVAEVVARRLGIECRAELRPAEKIEAIRDLQRAGHVVAMVGDGINDAPALAQADVGIAMGVAGTAAAIEAAHVALMQDDWRGVPEAIRTGRRTLRTIQQNLWFTAAYNVVGIALAAMGWLHPVAAAAAQSLPDVVVMLNSSRLLGDGRHRAT